MFLCSDTLRMSLKETFETKKKGIRRLNSKSRLDFFLLQKPNENNLRWEPAQHTIGDFEFHVTDYPLLRPSCSVI